MTVSQQPNLFDLPVTGYSHYGTPLPAMPYSPTTGPYRASDTSALAAVAITPKLGRWQRRVLLALYELGELTDEALERVLGCQATRTSRPRRRELELAGYVQDSGDRIRSDLTGALVTLWGLTPSGAALATRLRQEARNG